MTTPPPSPAHILRTHKAQINSVCFSDDNERLYSADLQGWVTLTSTRTLRPLARWQAHTDSVLGVDEWNETILTHGRDHKLHIWSRTLPPIELVETINISEIVSAPPLLYSLDVNALNFCRFHLLPSKDGTATLAVPNLVDSNYIDLWQLPSKDRLHAAIGKQHVQDSGRDDPSDRRLKLGAVMAVALFCQPVGDYKEVLHTLIGYEDGSVALYCRDDDDGKKTVEGLDWTQLWRVKEHSESVMAMSLAANHQFALTVSADYKIVKYFLSNFSQEKVSAPHLCKSAGHGAVAIRGDDKVFAVGGWDGKIRLYSTKSFKSLGTLSHHREGCYALAFAQRVSTGEIVEDDELDVQDQISRGLWLASGSKDARVCIWPLVDFQGQKRA